MKKKGGQGHFFRVGLPLITFVVAASFGLSVLVQGTKDLRARQPILKNDIPKQSKEFDLEKEYEVFDLL
jgi:hypothetical protein